MVVNDESAEIGKTALVPPVHVGTLPAPHEKSGLKPLDTKSKSTLAMLNVKLLQPPRAFLKSIKRLLGVTEILGANKLPWETKELIKHILAN